MSALPSLGGLGGLNLSKGPVSFGPAQAVNRAVVYVTGQTDGQQDRAFANLARDAMADPALELRDFAPVWGSAMLPQQGIAQGGDGPSAGTGTVLLLAAAALALFLLLR